MSGYEKSSIADLNDLNFRRQSQTFGSFPDYNASRAPQEPMYHFALPGRADSQLQPTLTPYGSHVGHMAAYGSSSDLQPRAAYTTIEPLYSDAGPQNISEVCTTYEPQTGTKESQVYVYLDSNSDLHNASSLKASLMFAERRVPASLTSLKAETSDGCFKYVVCGSAPAFLETESTSPLVSLRLQFQESTGADAGLIDVGLWRYEDEGQLALHSSPQISRKRRNTPDPQEALTSAKRISPTESQVTASDYGSYSYASPNLAYPQALRPIDLSSMSRKLTPYGKSQNQQNQQDDSTNLNVSAFPVGLSASQSLMRPPMTETSSCSPSYTTSYQFDQSPSLKTTPSFHMPSSIASYATNPPLVRASTLPQHAGSASNSAAASADENFNPYAMYPNRAIIKIRGGDLNSMQENWTSDERAAKRRLVRFQGEQDGSTINTYFKAVKPEERPSSHETRERRVSCIYWEERNEYFVTSVDTIALLETLVNTRFTVEEKNRIRRNLETHHPLTVAKLKPETESFFKVIMGLPNPKPRNIEKDVKVFPWPILGQALRKVISKYSASPASSARPSSTSRSLKFSEARADASLDRHPHLSPRSYTTSSPYASTLSSSTLSPLTPSHGLSTQFSQTMALPMPVAGLPQSYDFPTLATQYLQDGGRSLHHAHYNGQTSAPGLSPAYSAYTSSGFSRQRSDGVKAEVYDATRPSTRPRANTSFSAMYQATDPSADYSLSQLPSAIQAGRPSLDNSAYFRGDFGSFNHEDTQGTRYSLPSRSNSYALQYPQSNTETSTSQSAAQ